MKGTISIFRLLAQLTILVGLSACMPESPAPRSDLSASGTTTTGSSGGGTSSEVLATFNGETRNFIELGSTRVYDVQSIALESADSFLIWGENVQTRIKALPFTSKVCLLAEFKNTNPSRVLVMSALRRRTILNTQSTASGLVSTVAYSWIVFPGDQQRNQTDCLTTGIVNTKNQIFGTTTTLHYSLASVCSDCSNSPLSEGMRAHFDSGSVIPDLNISALKLRVQISTPQNGNGQGCSSNSVCAQIGFNCCLEGQCVKDGAIKTGVDTTSTSFIQAWEDVQNNPTRFTIYPHFFYVCPTTIPTVPGDNDATDPAFASLKRFNEMRDLFDCLNPQFDEIGYCTKKFPNASVKIKSGVAADQVFTAALDDNNFSWANPLLNPHSIYALRYGEQVLYQEDLTGSNTPVVANSHSLTTGGNGRIDQAQNVTVSKILPSNALDDTLIIKYKVDATCVKLSSALARCSKTYVQGRQSNPPRPSDHGSSSFFQLPHYADLVSFMPIVKVGDNLIAQSDSTWRVSGQGVLFTMPVTTNQTVTISYYATPTNGINLDILTTGRTLAQTRVNELCGCGVIGATNCNLAPVTQITGTTTSVTDYSCVYPPPPTPEPPLQQVVYVSAKTVPSRYYDINGAVWDNDSGASAPAQEGIEFRYTNSDPLRPNNITSYVGFHEIYGSFNKQGGSAKPPRMVNVKKDRIYDIFVDNGGFSSCDNCGNDPYSPILKLFPQSFSSRGGGYVPELRVSSRLKNTGLYRADDLLFGRACHVPATMLPWSHAENSSVATQRQRRLAAQHFMFANGYQRDWYGFDYGSLIGSFDGVTWFSIGNQRRIKASGSKLLLAVNGIIGDRTIDNNFKVVVSESISAVNSGSTVTHDTMSDGAECQKNHFCSNDNDCIAQLGYDYTCQNVSSITTPWPLFDTAGNETAGSQLRSLASIVGGVNGQARRCVYRGRGSPCEINLNSLLNTYNGTNIVGYAACSPNNYCARVDGQARFNQSIARFASSPSAQNLLGTLGTKDTVGLGSRIIGRPLDFYGNKAATSINSANWGFTSLVSLKDHLENGANVDGLCVPGRDVNSSTYAEIHSRVPPTNDQEAADRMYGVGPAGKVNSLSPTNSKMLSMCPAVFSGTFTHHNPLANLTDSALMAESVRQNQSSSLLDMTEYSSLAIFNTNSGSPATSIGYQRNACLRAPGASCFTDMECAPSEFIANKMRTLPSWGSFANNPAEQAYWKEELICGNPQPKTLLNNTLNPTFDLKQNRCCRDNDKTMQVFTQFDGDTRFLNCSGNVPAITGVNIPVNSAQRNPRNNVVFDIASCNPPEASKTPALIAPTPRTDPAAAMDIQKILNQFETFDKMNERMCCTGNWVRSFAPENGGGHRWGPGRTQNIDRTIFAAWSWYHDQKFTTTLDESQPMACSADNFGTMACEIRSLTDTQSRDYLNWIAQFELVGIPQALITIPTSANGLEKLVLETDQSNLETQGKPLDKTINEGAIRDVTDGSNNYISAASYGKMDVNSGRLKKVFSESEVNCCVPAGGTIPQSATANMCCTGTLTNEGGEARCCLDDFSDVTLYLNRYVSSEGRGLPASSYDAKTGYIKDPGQVFAIAQAKNLCCSGNIVQGNVIHDLFIPLQDGNRLPQAKSRRFAYRTDAIDNNSETGSIGDIYDAGLRWNTHFYCAPADYTPPGQQQGN